MPGKNGTGPRGQGPMTGRGAGFCAGHGRRFGGAGYDAGFGGGFGYGAGFPSQPVSEKSVLKARKEFLERELGALDERLSELDRTPDSE